MYDGVADGGAWEPGPLRAPVARLCENAKIPYTALDKLRKEHAIDVTGISLGQTHLGHLYRAHVLTTNT